jgi:hypothetical protein
VNGTVDNRFTLSTKIRADKLISPSEWVSPSEAARLRGVSRQAISKLIRLGRVSVLQIAGRNLVRMSEIKNFEPKQAGRKPKNKGSGKN